MDAPATTVTARAQSLRTNNFDSMYSLGSTDQRTVLSYSHSAETVPIYVESLVYRLSLHQVCETRGARRGHLNFSIVSSRDP